MTRVPRDPQPLEPWGPENRPHGFSWRNTEYRILRRSCTYPGGQCQERTVRRDLQYLGHPHPVVGAKPDRLARIPEGRDGHRYAVRDLPGPAERCLVPGEDLRLTMDKEFWLLLTVAGIAMVSSAVTVLSQSTACAHSCDGGFFRAAPRTSSAAEASVRIAMNPSQTAGNWRWTQASLVLYN